MIYIYMDEWVWIDISNALNGKIQQSHYKDFLRVAQKNVANNIWALTLWTIGFIIKQLWMVLPFCSIELKWMVATDRRFKWNRRQKQG